MLFELLAETFVLRLEGLNLCLVLLELPLLLMRVAEIDAESRTEGNNQTCGKRREMRERELLQYVHTMLFPFPE